MLLLYIGHLSEPSMFVLYSRVEEERKEELIKSRFPLAVIDSSVYKRI